MRHRIKEEINEAEFHAFCMWWDGYIGINLVSTHEPPVLYHMWDLTRDEAVVFARKLNAAIDHYDRCEAIAAGHVEQCEQCEVTNA